MAQPNGQPEVPSGDAKNFVSPGDDFVTQMNIAQLQAFYNQFVQQLSAVCTIANGLPLQELLRANERLRTSGVLAVPPGVPAEQVQQWVRNLENDHKLLVNLVNTLAPLKG